MSSSVSKRGRIKGSPDAKSTKAYPLLLPVIRSFPSLSDVILGKAARI